MNNYIGKILGNRYEILEKVGEGGMSLVFKARCNMLNRFVAVKVLRPEFSNDEDFVEKFKRESQASASLSHPSIVNIYDVGQDEGIHYIVMELIAGSTLKQFIKDLPSGLTEFEMISIAKQIAEALEHAHKNHIIHRDIKSQNVLVTESGRIKVADFGIARAISSSTITNTAEVIGSVHYTSPEQARGGFIDERSDIYSLGVVLYEMATKKLPFDGESPVTVALMHIKEDVPNPMNYNRNLNTGLVEIIMKAMQKSPSSRFQSATELIRDLNKLILDPNIQFAYSYQAEDSPTMVMPKIFDTTNNIESYDEKEFKAVIQKKEKNQKKGLLFSIGAGVVLSIVIFAVLFQMIFGGGLNNIGGKPVVVPDVEKISVEAAITSLQELGFSVRVIANEDSEEIPKDFVISQSPKGGENVKSGSMIDLTVSNGGVGSSSEGQTEVPSLVNRVLEDARKLIDNAGFKAGTVEYMASDLPRGVVVEQFPKAGNLSTTGGSIDIKVSEGQSAANILMPNLIGKNINDAKDLLSSIKLNVGNITTNYSETYAENAVIEQSIKDGTKVKENDKIDVVISKGKDPSGTVTPVDPPAGGKSLLYQIPVSSAANETFILKVVVDQNGVETVAYEKQHSRTENPVRVSVTITETAIIKFYFDDQLINQKTEVVE